MKQTSSVRILLCSLLGIAGWYTQVFGQASEVNVTGGLGLNVYSASFSQLGPYASCCPEFTGGTGLGWWLGVGYTRPLSASLRLGAQLVYNVQSGTMTYDEHSFVADLRDTPRVRDAVFHHELQSIIQSVGIEPRVSYRLFADLDVSLGVRLAYVTRAHFTQTETLVQPEDYGSYLGTNRTWVNHDADIPESRTFFAGLLASLRYSLPLTRQASWLVQPEIAVVVPLTSVTAATNWSVFDVRFGLGIAHTLGSARDANLDTAAVTDIHDSISPLPPVVSPDPVGLPTATVLIEGIEGGKPLAFDTVRIEETRIVDYLPVLPFVYFNQGVATIPDRLMPKSVGRDDTLQLTDAAQAIVSNIRIIAQRLHDLPGVSVDLVGCISDAEVGLPGSARLAADRVAVVRRVFEAYGISGDRITSRTRKLPAIPTHAANPSEAGLANEENQRVEIVPSERSILRPHILATIHRTISPDTIRITRTVTAPAGIERLEFDGVLEQVDQLSRHHVQATREMESLDVPDSVTIVVQDSSGSVARAGGRIPTSTLTFERKRTEHRDNAEVERYSLILFGFDDATVTEAHREVLERIRKRMANGARVRVLGSTDSMGSADYNYELSRKRALEVARTLGLGPESVDALGASTPRFSNDTPEGRAYNRTVIIEVR